MKSTLFNLFKRPIFTQPLLQLESVRKSITTNPDWPDSLKSLLNHPIPTQNTVVDDLQYLAIDFETTGIEATENSILSMACINLFQSKIDMSSAEHTYLNTLSQINAESAVINHIVPEMLLEGNQLDVAMALLFERMHGKVLLVHGAVIEKSFIDKYVNERFGIKQLPVVWIDTLKIEKCLVYRQDEEIDSLQLSDVRKKYRLPAYPAHNALIDSIACAELFLAQMTHIFGDDWRGEKLSEIYLRV